MKELTSYCVNVRSSSPACAVIPVEVTVVSGMSAPFPQPQLVIGALYACSAVSSCPVSHQGMKKAPV